MRLRFLFCFVLLASAARPQPAAEFPLKDQDTVVFYGDSITDQRLYTTFVETYVVTRFPQRQIRFIHSGWGGDRVSGGAGGPIDLRLQRDVFAYRPTVMTIMLGMNDGAYRAMEQERFDKFRSGYEHIVESAKLAFPDIRITVIQPSPYDDATRPALFEGGYNNVLLKYSEYLAELADKRKLQVADLNGPVMVMLTKAYELDPANAQKIIPDRVHPGAAGHLSMAQALLTAWHAPATVTEVDIDAAEGKVVRSENTKVEDLQAAERLTWTQRDGSLPMPVDDRDPVMKLVLKASNFVQSLNRQPLIVRGLRAEQYTLSINGTPVGTFSRGDLEQGINLASLPTPMAKQAAAVHALTLKHNNVHNARWRTLQTPLADDKPAHLESAMRALDELEEDLVAHQRRTAQPVACWYELAPVMPAGTAPGTPTANPGIQ